MPEPEQAESSDALIAVLKGIAASLVFYWVGVWVVQVVSEETLMPNARYVGWLACAIGTYVTAKAVGQPRDESALFAVLAFFIAIPLTFMGESTTLLRNLTFAARMEAVTGRRPDPLASSRYLAFHVLPAVFGGITLLCLMGTLMFRNRTNSV